MPGAVVWTAIGTMLAALPVHGVARWAAVVLGPGLVTRNPYGSIWMVVLLLASIDRHRHSHPGWRRGRPSPGRCPGGRGGTRAPRRGAKRLSHDADQAVPVARRRRSGADRGCNAHRAREIGMPTAIWLRVEIPPRRLSDPRRSSGGVTRSRRAGTGRRQEGDHELSRAQERAGSRLCGQARTALAGQTGLRLIGRTSPRLTHPPSLHADSLMPEQFRAAPGSRARIAACAN
jgi:hypothetical protein